MDMGMGKAPHLLPLLLLQMEGKCLSTANRDK
jgi:hypothetical protein